MTGYNTQDYGTNSQINGNGFHMGLMAAERQTMPTIDFYTARIDPYSRAVKMLATHLNIPLNEIYVRPFTDTQTDKYTKINPCHTVPTIDDNGFVLWESRAIMQYLCNKYAPNSSLYPKDPQLRGTVDRLLNFDLKTLSHAVLSAHFEYTLPNEYSASRSEKLVELTDALTFLEIFLINKDYVAGDNLTIADISIIANVTHLEIAVEFDISSYPNIWGWFNRLRRELPYYDELTKVAHAEHRELIRKLRSAHDDWSTQHFCPFCHNFNGEPHSPENCNGQVQSANGADIQVLSDQTQTDINEHSIEALLFSREYSPQQLNGVGYDGQTYDSQTYDSQTYESQTYNGFNGQLYEEYDDNVPIY